jgi:colanic acid/amylovoran biosynthesis glycosyltransferase
MKVLHALESYLPVSENWIYPQITRPRGTTPAVLCAELHNLDLFPLNGAPRFLDPPPWSAGLGIPRLINSLAFRLGGRGTVVAGAAARRWKPDLIHAHFGMRGWQMLGLRRKLGVRLLTSFYGLDAWQLPHSSQLWRDRFAELFAEGDAFLAEGPAMGARLAAIGCPPERIQVARLGVDCAALPFDRKEFSAPLRVLMMARFIEKKGLCDGLRACAEAVRMGANLEVTLIGGATPGSAAGERIEAELREIAASDALRGRVRFEGFLKPLQARELLRKADIFLCPSKHAADGDAEGGSPLALTEAMALGLLCIGTRHCDIPEVIRHEQTGYVAESGDIAGLAALLVRAADEPENSQALCVQGRAHIEAHFSTAEQVLELERIYGRLAPGGSAPQPC